MTYAAWNFCEVIEPSGFEMSFAFQPIVDMRRMRIFGYEALVSGAEGAPAEAVLSRLTDANRYAFDLAARQKAIALAARLFPANDGIHLSLDKLPNALCASQIGVQDTALAARMNGFPYKNLIFGLTEQERVCDVAQLRETFRRYAELGFGTAIDDFGRGFSGLGFLSEFTPNMIKIGKELVRGIHVNRSRQAILKGILDLTRTLGIAVTAEGVETKEELDYLLTRGVEYFQGYLFAHPGFECLPEVDLQSLAFNDNAAVAPALLVAA